MDGQFYIDNKPPFVAVSQATITLSSSYTAMILPGLLPIMGNEYFSYPGKAVRMRFHGQMTSGATPGNVTFAILYGTGASGNGNLIAGVNFGWTANVTGMAFQAEWYVRCRSIGASGTLFGTGYVNTNSMGFVLMPPTSPVAVTNDLTQPGYNLSFQMQRSGSTAETAQVHDFMYEALN